MKKGRYQWVFLLCFFCFLLFVFIDSLKTTQSLCLCLHVVVVVVCVLFFSRCNGYWPYIRRNNFVFVLCVCVLSMKKKKKKKHGHHIFVVFRLP